MIKIEINTFSTVFIQMESIVSKLFLCVVQQCLKILNLSNNNNYFDDEFYYNTSKIDPSYWYDPDYYHDKKYVRKSIKSLRNDISDIIHPDSDHEYSTDDLVKILSIQKEIYNALGEICLLNSYNQDKNKEIIYFYVFQSMCNTHEILQLCMDESEYDSLIEPHYSIMLLDDNLTNTNHVNDLLKMMNRTMVIKFKEKINIDFQTDNIQPRNLNLDDDYWY